MEKKKYAVDVWLGKRKGHTGKKSNDRIVLEKTFLTTRRTYTANGLDVLMALPRQATEQDGWTWNDYEKAAKAAEAVIGKAGFNGMIDIPEEIIKNEEKMRWLEKWFDRMREKGLVYYRVRRSSL